MVLIKQSFRSRVQALHILFTLFLAFRFLLLFHILYKSSIIFRVSSTFLIYMLSKVVSSSIFRNSEHFGFAGEQIETEERLNILWRALKNSTFRWALKLPKTQHLQQSEIKLGIGQKVRRGFELPWKIHALIVHFRRALKVKLPKTQHLGVLASLLTNNETEESKLGIRQKARRGWTCFECLKNKYVWPSLDW